MNVNKELLQYYSFKLNKKINNLVEKNSKKELEYLFNNELEQLFDFVKNGCKKEDIIIQLSNCHNCHKIDNNNKDLLIKIIEKCYENLYNSLLQKFESDDEKDVFNNINFYQCAINKRSRLIFVLKDDKFIPIIFDLKHVIYLVDGFDNNSKQEIYRWSYRYKNKKVKIRK